MFAYETNSLIRPLYPSTKGGLQIAEINCTLFYFNLSPTLLAMEDIQILFHLLINGSCTAKWKMELCFSYLHLTQQNLKTLSFNTNFTQFIKPFSNHGIYLNNFDFKMLLITCISHSNWLNHLLSTRCLRTRTQRESSIWFWKRNILHSPLELLTASYATIYYNEII